MNTEIIRVNPANMDMDKIRFVAESVDNGKLAVFPTETVYGIACRVEKSSFAKLDQLKGRPSDKRYSLHIAAAEAIKEYVPSLSFRTRKLIKNCWPGPVTIVFELSEEDLALQKARVGQKLYDILYQDGTLGVRCPDNPVAIALLSECKKPIVAPSANLNGQKPAISAEMVMDQMDGRVDVILVPEDESDACKYQVNSTVVKITSKKIDILRQGAVKKEDIERMSQMGILFVCTGNTCRSPMAEYFCKKYIAEKLECNLDEIENKGYKIASAGIFAYNGAPASSEIVDICSQKGIDASAHRSRLLTPEMVEEADVIYAMTRSHADGVLDMSPQAKSKCRLLDAENDIPDPIGGSSDVYNKCAQSIKRALNKRLSGIIV